MNKHNPKRVFPKKPKGWDAPFVVIEESENYYIVQYQDIKPDKPCGVDALLKPNCEEATEEIYKYWEELETV